MGKPIGTRRIAEDDLAAADFTRLLRELAQSRVGHGLSQAEVARRMGVSQPYVARLEAADIDPRISTLLKYAAVVAGGLALGAILKDILGDSRADL